jgi:murein L,D-transpeptidase YafK
MFFVLLGCSASPSLSTHQELSSLSSTAPQEGILIVAEKAKRRISIYEDGELLMLKESPASWSIGLGDAPIGHKQREGDERTPEGLYAFSDWAPSSQYHGSLLIHYPNSKDARAALESERITRSTYEAIVEAEEQGLAPPMNTVLGGYLLIHGPQKSTGLPPKAGSFDWTNGCMAMASSDLDLLRSRLSTLQGRLLIVP